MPDTQVIDTKPTQRPETRVAGVLLAATLLEILAIAHHPHVQSRNPAEVMLEIVAVSPLAGWIHGLAIGCSFLIAYCLGELLAPRIPSSVGRAAALVYGGGLSALVTAATLDGWVLERLAAGSSHANPMDLDGNARLLALCMAWVVASTNIGIVMTSAGIAIASAGLLRCGGRWRIAALFGLALGAGLSLSILTGRLAMDGHGILAAVLLQAAWFCILSIVALTAGINFLSRPAPCMSENR